MSARTLQAAGTHVPPLRREGRLVAGVAAGIADAVEVDPFVIRAAFVVLTVTGGVGILLYLAAAVVMATNGDGAESRSLSELSAAGQTERVIAIALVTVGIALLADALGLGFGERISRPVGLVGLGVLVAWHRGRLGSLVEGDRGRLLRVGIGLLLACAGIMGVLVLNLDLVAARDTLLLSVAVAGGLALIAAPTIRSLLHDLAEERRQRIRSEERARVAAHLHDSVLQTLSLIQRNAEDPRQMRSLARRQERELRSWLFGTDEDRLEGTLRGALERICTDVESAHDLPVEFVVVGGETQVDSRIRDVLAAAREAMVNAAKHSGAPRIDVFAEVSEGTLELFVRDVGKGFDPRTVPDDRHGVADSIVARLERIGGKAAIQSAPGEGTEVELTIELSEAS